MTTISQVISGISPRAWHNIIPVGDGTAWASGGQVPSSYGGTWGCYQSAQRFDLTTGIVSATQFFPYGYAHSPAFLIGGRLCTPGGMGMVGTSFTALDEIQEVDTTSGTQNWQHSLSSGGCGPGYDLCAAQLPASGTVIYAGGHGWDSTAQRSWSRFDAAIVDYSVLPPNITAHPGLLFTRVYANTHAIDSSHVVFALGWNYGDQNVERRNLDSIEVLGVDGSRHVLATVTNARRYGVGQFYADTGVLYLLGGTRNPASGRPAACTDVDAVNVITGAVTPMPPLQLARYHAASCRVQMSGRNYICLAGGQSANGVAVSSIELYCTDDGSSTIIGAMPFNSADHDRICATLGSKMIVVGGEDCAANNIVSLSGFAPMAIIDFGTGAVCSRN